jgi:hypothetical protein
MQDAWFLYYKKYKFKIFRSVEEKNSPSLLIINS